MNAICCTSNTIVFQDEQEDKVCVLLFSPFLFLYIPLCSLLCRTFQYRDNRGKYDSLGKCQSFVSFKIYGQVL